MASQGISNGFENVDWQQVGFDTLSGAVSGAIATGIFNGFGYLAKLSMGPNRILEAKYGRAILNNTLFIYKNTSMALGSAYNISKNLYRYYQAFIEQICNAGEGLLDLHIGSFVSGEWLWNYMKNY